METGKNARRTMEMTGFVLWIVKERSLSPVTVEARTKAGARKYVRSPRNTLPIGSGDRFRNGYIDT